MKDLSLHVMDILQNSTRAGAKNITLDVEESKANDTLTLRFIDDGCGMNEETVKKVQDPFYTTRTTRKVGLGLPLLKQNAEQTGGWMNITSQPNVGTEVTVVFRPSNIDCPPMGDLAGTVVLTVSAYPDIHFVFHYKTEEIDYTLDTNEVIEVLDGVPINNPDIVEYLKDMVAENIRHES